MCEGLTMANFNPFSVNNRIAICYTTFMRDDLMFKTMKSMLDIYQKNWIILVADQGKPSKAKIEYFKQFSDDINSPNVLYYQLPFDCGLSYARNFLIKQAKELNCHYSLITADSIAFTYTMANLGEAVSLLSRMNSCGIMGLNLLNRFPWEYNIELVEGKYFKLKHPTVIKQLANNMGNLVVCDMVKNFFIAKTDALLQVQWDEELKLCEHEDFFWRFKKSGWKVCYINVCDGKYIDSKPELYKKFRSRMYNVYRDKLRKKYNIKGWIYYEKKPKK